MYRRFHRFIGNHEAVEALRYMMELRIYLVAQNDEESTTCVYEPHCARQPSYSFCIRNVDHEQILYEMVAALNRYHMHCPRIGGSEIVQIIEQGRMPLPIICATNTMPTVGNDYTGMRTVVSSF